MERRGREEGEEEGEREGGSVIVSVRPERVPVSLTSPTRAPARSARVPHSLISKCTQICMKARPIQIKRTNK